MPHSSPYSPPSVFLHYRPQRWIFPPRAPYLTDMHLLSPQREGGCLLCFLLNPTRLLASITQRTPEKCSLKRKSVYSLVKLRCLDPRSFGHTTLVRCFIHVMDIDWTSQLEESHILWRVASTGNNEECQSLSHLLAFYILPNSSPAKVQTPERLTNSPRNRAFSWRRECSRL